MSFQTISNNLEGFVKSNGYVTENQRENIDHDVFGLPIFGGWQAYVETLLGCGVFNVQSTCVPPLSRINRFIVTVNIILPPKVRQLITHSPILIILVISETANIRIGLYCAFLCGLRSMYSSSAYGTELQNFLRKCLSVNICAPCMFILFLELLLS
jgi:hypothetical protein